jgi:hypothetical protein
MVAFGFTVTFKLKVLPAQLPDNVEILYVAVCGRFVGLVKVPDIVAEAVAFTPPVSPPVTVGVAQVNCVFVGITSVPVGLNVNEVALHIGAVVLSAIVGLGFTTTLIVKVPPVQLPTVGVIVYKALCCVLVGLVNVPLIVVAPEAAMPPINPPVTVGKFQV